jgi:hypothetical protein
MRIEIKTKTPAKDPDIKALYLLEEAMKVSTPRMRKANIQFVLSKWGIKP